MKKTWKTKFSPIKDLGGWLGVQLSDGSFALVDYQDRVIVEGWRWTAHHERNGTYAVRGGLAMHRAIMGGLADHKNGDTLDNRRSNLRQATAQQNTWNRARASNNTSGFKGVCPRKDRGTWLAAIRYNEKLKKLGTFHSKEAAAMAYDRAARALFGEFAALNFPNPEERQA